MSRSPPPRSDSLLSSSEGSNEQSELENNSEDNLASDRTQIISDPDDCTDEATLFQFMDLLAKEARQDEQERLLERLVEDLECPLCTGLIIDPVALSCGHTLCKKCAWTELDNKMCMACGTVQKKSRILEKNYIVAEAVALHVRHLPEELRLVYERRRREHAERMAQVLETPKEQDPPPPPRNPMQPGLGFMQRRGRRRRRLRP